jgi:exodeoxyribonuclease VII large subunit
MRLGMDAILLEAAREVGSLSGQLDAFSPLRTLERGYAIVEKDGRAVRDAAVLSVGDRLRIRFARGEVGARVEEGKG